MNPSVYYLSESDALASIANGDEASSTVAMASVATIEGAMRGGIKAYFSLLGIILNDYSFLKILLMTSHWIPLYLS